MANILPLNLVGHTLGERLRYLNKIVNNTYEQKVPLQSLLNLPELSPIDRIFKIDLASKYRDVNYIIENLKDKDMLYVSRALKLQWLLEPEYSHIINPVYLESYLYPDMTTTAVNKMKNYIELNLKDPSRCQEFYEYYKSNFDVAIKFLWHCSKKIIVEQVTVMIDKLTPKHLRILCEACPLVAKLYFEALENNKSALQRYIKSKRNYHHSIMSVLKVDGNLYLDLIERYFDKDSLKPLGPVATKYIMKNYKNRYLNKPELYATWLLHMKTLAKFLNNDEIKDVLFRLARAKYLGWSFTYKNVEPFIKRLNGEERTSIKKQIFVDKLIGTEIETWPYSPPVNLGLLYYDSDCKPLEDIKHNPYDYDHIINECIRTGKRKIRKRCVNKFPKCSKRCISPKSNLEKLFDNYRFMNFDKVLFEFRKLLVIEGTIEGRRDMILVLVSKAGSNETKVQQLLKFLVERHSNEAENLRDAVARSMVKRAFAWRLPAETWELLLKWANTTVREMLHATVLRHLIANTQCPAPVIQAYLLDFSDLNEYSLNGAEKAVIVERLPALLISANEPSIFLNTLKAYNLRIYRVPGAEAMLVAAARNDESILRSIYQSRIARKHLLAESFKMLQTDEAYMNALKHDMSVLANGEMFTTLLSKEKSKHDRFLRTLVLYFSEPDGLAARHLSVLERAIHENCRESFARPFAFLLSASNKSLQGFINNEVKYADVEQKKFAAALRANAFVARPVIDIEVIEWRVFGAKFISNKVLICSDKDVDAYIQKTLKWKKTMRVALRLALRNDSVRESLATVIEARPTVALKFVLSDVQKGTVDSYMWNQIKPVIRNLDLTKTSLKHVRRILGDLDLKTNIEAEYWSTAFEVFRKAGELEALPMLCKMESILTEVHESSINCIITDFIREKLNMNLIKDEKFSKSCISLYFRVIAKYLLLSETEEDQKTKVENVCDPFFDKIDIIYKEVESESKVELIECLDDFFFALKYTEVFLNTKYVPCTLMFERIVERMSHILPRTKYFEKYVHIHLTMLYYRSVRQAMRQKSEVFNDRQLVQDAAIRTVGFILGKYLSMEIQELVQNYFTSVIDLYRKGIVRFFQSYFQYNKSVTLLALSTVRGLIEGQSESQLLAQHVFAKYDVFGDVFDEERQEIFKLLKQSNNEELKLFLFETLYSY